MTRDDIPVAVRDTVWPKNGDRATVGQLHREAIKAIRQVVTLLEAVEYAVDAEGAHQAGRHAVMAEQLLYLTRIL